MIVNDLRIKIFADGASLSEIHWLTNLPYIKGFTTNPSLMRKAGVDDYEHFARLVLDIVPDKPVSFEVLADDCAEMERQARKIAAWGENVYVKVPITTTGGESTTGLIGRLLRDRIKVNVTAVTTLQQVRVAYLCRYLGTPMIMSVFAGRVADTGQSAKKLMRQAADAVHHGDCELLWASTREVYNIVQAEKAGCDIITVPDAILAKLPYLGKDLTAVSLEMVRQFHDDAAAAGYTL